MIRTLLSICLLITTLTVTAKDPIRVEIETKHGDHHTIVPIGNKGVLFFYHTANSEGNQPIWEFYKLNTELKEVWKKEYPVLKGLTYINHDYSGSNLFVLLANPSSITRYQIIRINVDTGKINDFIGEAPMKLDFVDFKVLGTKAIIGANKIPTNAGIYGRSCLAMSACYLPILFGFDVKPTNAMFVHYDFDTKRSKILAPNTRGTSFTQDLSKDTLNQRFEAVVSTTERNQDLLTLKAFNKNGQGLGTLKIVSGEERSLLTARIAFSDKEEKVVMGTYTPQKLRKASTGTAGASGVYFTKIESGKQKFIKYHHFKEFESFWEYLSHRSSNRIHKKLMKDEARGKETNLSYNLLVHDLQQHGDELIMVGEAYYPEYHTETYWTTGPNGQPTMQTRQVFDGWRYTHAIIAGFNKDGDLLWNNSFPIMDILTFDLRERIKTVRSKDKMILVYSYGGSIKSKTIQGNNVIDNKSITEIPTFDDTELARRNQESDIEYWYDKNFIAFGYQVIKDIDERPGNKKRSVFYFTKVDF